MSVRKRCACGAHEVVSYEPHNPPGMTPTLCVDGVQHTPNGCQRYAPRANPTALADQAAAASEAGRWEEAAKLYREAAGACLGHNRAARYEACADECAEKAKVAKALKKPQPSAREFEAFRRGIRDAERGRAPIFRRVGAEIVADPPCDAAADAWPIEQRKAYIDGYTQSV